MCPFFCVPNVHKTEGAIMKAKYQNKEITAEEFEKWIISTKK